MNRSVPSEMLWMLPDLDGELIASVCLVAPFATVMDMGGSAGWEPSAESSINSPAQILDFILGATVAPKGRVAGWKDVVSLASGY